MTVARFNKKPYNGQHKYYEISFIRYKGFIKIIIRVGELGSKIIGAYAFEIYHNFFPPKL